MDRKLLDILACPATRQPLSMLEARGLAALNAAIAQGLGLRLAVGARDAARGDRRVQRRQAARVEHRQRLARGGAGEDVQELAVHRWRARGQGVGRAARIPPFASSGSRMGTPWP